ncbi:MAG TPA: MFS transporter, partial [Gammaproteobacteria bacterium]|nr:MFS transporter [Gammaproteobacteria bacterium]
FVGYLVGAALMAVGGLVALAFAVDAERKPLEHVATPLSAVERVKSRERARASGERFY